LNGPRAARIRMLGANSLGMVHPLKVRLGAHHQQDDQPSCIALTGILFLCMLVCCFLWRSTVLSLLFWAPALSLCHSPYWGNFSCLCNLEAPALLGHHVLKEWGYCARG
jgi:hypothetical protein